MDLETCNDNTSRNQNGWSIWYKHHIDVFCALGMEIYLYDAFDTPDFVLQDNNLGIIRM